MQLWPKLLKNETFDNYNAFSVAYSKDMDKKIDLHTDDSAVTINYCLGSEFTGGDLIFKGATTRDQVYKISEKN